MRKLTHAELVARQQKQQLPKVPLVIVLNNIRSLYNVGSLFRTADAVGAQKLWLCGITGMPPETMISKTALGSEKSVEWEYSKKAETCLGKLKRDGYKIVLLEQIECSRPYQEFTVKEPVCLVVGNEVGGVSEELLQLSDDSIEIEMMGLKNSLNVAVALGIVAYHIRHQFTQQTLQIF